MSFLENFIHIGYEIGNNFVTCDATKIGPAFPNPAMISNYSAPSW